MNRGALRSTVIKLTGRADKASDIDDALGLAVRELAAVHPWRVLKVEEELEIEDGDLEVELPAGTLHLIDARVIDGTMSGTLALIPRKRFNLLYPNVVAASASKPVVGWVDASVLHFAPKAGADYVLRVTVVQTPVFGAGDSVENPIEGTDSVLIAHAASYVFMVVQNLDMSGAWERRWKERLLMAIREDRRTYEDNQAQFHGARTLVSSSAPWLDPFDKGG